ncbi:MAG: leucine-rich repeat protein [Clostridia bacterium]|nr:leucine-rich repeat protein [Clostridia bacterium]
MKKIIIILTLLLTLSLLFSCGGNDPSDGGTPPPASTVPAAAQEAMAALNLSNIKLLDKTVNYTGGIQKLNLGGTLPKNVSAELENNTNKNAGSYTVVCKFYYSYTDPETGTVTKYHVEGKDLTATLTIKPVAYDLSDIYFTDKTVVYNGAEHGITLLGTLPEGVTVSYSGGNKTEAGSYTVTAHLGGDSNHLPIEDMTATLTIERAAYDISGILFPDKTVGYDGKSHTVSILGTLPEGVTVSYSGGNKTEVGSYTVTASFTSSNANYLPIPDMTASLAISATKLPGITLEGAVFVYNGQPHSLSVSGTLPSDVTVEYEGNGVTDAGEYTIVAKFSEGGTYNPALDLTATAVILKASLSASAEDLTADYDGTEKSIILSGNIPSDVRVIAYGNGRIAPGSYTVIFRFIPENPDNYNAIPDVVATLTVNAPTTEAVTDGLVFELKNGSYTVTGYNGSDTTVIIPKTYEGKNVTSVKSEAFRGNTTVKYVKIPSTVMNIGNGAFRGCTALREVELGSGLRTVGQLAFDGTALIEITLPDGLEAIGHGAFRSTPLESITLPFVGGSRNSSNKYLGFIFGADDYVGNVTAVPKTLISVTLSDACTLIPAYSFYGCDSLESVYIGAKTSEIGIAAFSYCTALRKIYIPSTVLTIPAEAYYYNSPFFACSESLVIVTGHGKAPELTLSPSNPDGTGFGEFWSHVGKDTPATVVYGKSYYEFLEM